MCVSVEMATFVGVNMLIMDRSIYPQIRNFVCCGLMGWDLIRLVMPMAGIELQIAADVHSYPLPTMRLEEIRC